MDLIFDSRTADRDFLERVLDFLPYPFLLSEFKRDTYHNTYINQKFQLEIGYGLHEIPTIDVWFYRAYPDEKYREDVIKGWTKRFEEAQNQGYDAIVMKVEIQTKNNGMRWYEVKSSLIDNLQVVAFINIHEEVMQKQELRNLNENKNQVLSVLTHDLRSPIQSLQGIMKLALKNDLSQVEFIKLLSDLNERSRNILDLLDTTLLWAKSNFNSIQFKQEPVDVQQIAKQVSLAYDNFIQVKQLQLVLNVSADKPRSDPDVIHIVLRNLLSNSIKFTPMGGKIEIRGEMVNGLYELVVQDTGIGMDPEGVKKVLLESGISSRGTLNEHGIGIGLSLCMQLLSRIGGKLSIESKRGSGTVVRIML